jgi:integrase
VKRAELSQMKARALPPGKHADGQGLWLFKREKDRGKWMLRLVVHGTRREMGMGAWPDVSIAEARRKAEDARMVLRDGKDPVYERKRVRRAKKPLTVKEAIEGCFEARKGELKGEGTAGRWMSPMKVHVIPKIGHYPVTDVDQHVLKELLDPIWNAKPDAAEKALQRMTLTLKYAAANGLDVDLQATMKALALLGAQRKTVEHIPSLAYEEAPAFYKWLCGINGAAALGLRFLILTLARTTEIRMMTIGEVKGDVWTLPGERTKTDTLRRIPLVPDAVMVVELCRARSKNDYLFPAHRGKPMSDNAMSTFMTRHGYIARPHGFRATFRTWVEETTDTPFELKEAVLGHAVDSDVVEAYQRSDRFKKRRAIMEEWVNFLLTQH